MPFPETVEEMKDAGYEFKNEGDCRGCRVRIQWWKTPLGRNIPMDVDEDGNVQSHWASCPKAKDFRGKR